MLDQILVDLESKTSHAVAQYLYNGNEYLESLFACFKAALVPVNTNFRYVHDELVYLWDNADVAAVVFHGAFAEHVDAVRTRVPNTGTGTCVVGLTSDSTTGYSDSSSV